MMEWVLTYAVHSTALIAAVWLLTTVISRLSLGTREALWKAALLGPLATATVVTAAGVPSLWGPIPVPDALRTEPATVVVSEASPATTDTATPTVERRIVRHQTGELQIIAVRQRQAAPAAVAAAPTPAAPVEPTPWPMVLLGLWGLGAAAALGRLTWAAVRLNKQLKGRRDVIEDPVLESFLDLCSKAGLEKRPRLTASPHLRSPIALGRKEICLPERAVDSLGPRQQQGMLAHEMAHLLRYDPVWSVALALVEAVFFFQPLNHLARKKIQEVAEFQCDDWAARQTGTGVHLAKCLAEVAGWVEDGPPTSPAVVAMADRGSPIVRRITRLLHERRNGGRVHPVGRVALTVGSLGLVIAAVPRVSQAEASVRRAAPAAPTAVLAASDLQGVVFEDHSDGEHDRSRVRLLAGDEVVEIEVQAPRPAPVPPPPVPESRDEGADIMIFGSVGHPFWGCCGGGVWSLGGVLGVGNVEMFIGSSGLLGWTDGLLGLGLPGVELHMHGFEHERAERAMERAERARQRAERAHERAERARQRALRHRERALGMLEREIERHEDEDDSWPSIFGVSLEREESDESQVVIEL